MLITIVGYVVIAAIVVLLIREVAALPPIFILIPVIGALICGFSPAEICGFVGQGIEKVLNTALLFAFSILYFSILGEAGIFQALARRLVRHMGNNVYLLLAVTFVMASVIQMDGSGAMTMLIVIPLMIPLYDAMKIRRTALVCVCAMGAGVMNMLPWCSAVLRVSAGTGVEAQELWQTLLPVQGATFVFGLLLSMLIAFFERRRGAGMTEAEFQRLRGSMEQDGLLKVPVGIAVFDGLFTVALLALLLSGVLNSTVAFMIGLGVILVVHYRTAKAEDAVIKKFSATAYPLVLTIFSIGAMLGILQGTGMIDSIAYSLMALIPEGSGGMVTFLYSLVGVPISMVIGSDCCYSVIAPLLGTISGNFGGGMLMAASAVLISSSMAASISFVGPVPYMTVDLAGTTLKKSIRFSFPYLWALGILMALSAKVMGLV